MFLKRLLILLIGIPLGLAIIKFREKIYQWTGPINFAEKYLGNGGTFTLIAILGGIVVVGTIIYFTGAHEVILGKLVNTIKF
ncbi:hypothetical protein COV81_05365 [Candidatus Peregrinibacteria bacterium CG11_big_fil_rev_8_21_14_0_20_41_10]|nr:MAG: hypothetical protein COV81_05365 [Candidatus Peregrinibacteria bacterium CG11_big_fil_rev_8_21_14_0_20_41_10]PIZ77799.1 MAG: hypothetical protein COY06_00225 [Candidatus Peregrinibacteria bacterium CG_4_10_14_0_2_um_filter_41_8]PJC38402.1 MAG: hypothetical protein CO045_00495 [Candidatus Peregrinibacteria bacterium CG_4_9_14_0_2_um_filter_41_14]